jgi:hypothetical protein
VADADAWSDWWRKRGEERLTLLLWAVWNPIGPVPLDEYESYTGEVVAVLRRREDADRELTGNDPSISDSTQRQRNKLYNSAVLALSELLGSLRDTQMGMPPDPKTDRRAAETLLDWYGWEMNDLTGIA